MTLLDDLCALGLFPTMLAFAVVGMVLFVLLQLLLGRGGPGDDGPL